MLSSYCKVTPKALLQDFFERKMGCNIFQSFEIQMQTFSGCIHCALYLFDSVQQQPDMNQKSANGKYVKYSGYVYLKLSE